MNKNQMAAMKLRTAMSGLKTAYREAPPEDRKVIIATMREIQSIHAQLVKADEGEDEEMVDDMESDAEAMPDEESAAEMGMDEDMGEMSMDEDVAMAEEPMDEMSEDGEMAAMDEAHMSESDMMDEDMGMDMEQTVEVEGLDIPEEFIGDLGDLGLLDMGDEGEEAPEGEMDEDEELAVAALTLAANALRAMKDEPESSQEEVEPAEEHEDVLDEEDILALQGEGLLEANSTVKKLREISARLSKVKTLASKLDDKELNVRKASARPQSFSDGAPRPLAARSARLRAR